jgi:hypothetical protein
MLSARFRPYPYQGGARGLLVIPPRPCGKRPPAKAGKEKRARAGARPGTRKRKLKACKTSRQQVRRRRTWAATSSKPPTLRTRAYQLQLSADYTADLAPAAPGDGLVHRAALGLRFDSSMRLGFESRFSLFVEQLPAPRGGVDQLLIGDLNLTLRIAQHEQAQVYAGLGVRGLIDGASSTAGINTTYGLDLFPLAPLVISLQGDLGHLGAAFYLEGRATLGVTLGRLELYAGYEATLIGDVGFHDPTFGLRIWL